MRVVLFVLANCWFIQASFGQWMVGVKGGIGLNSVSVIQIQNIQNSVQENLIGMDFGLVADRTLTEYLSVRGELVYTQKGYSVRRYGSSVLFGAGNRDKSDYHSLTNNYLQIPIMIRYYEGFKRLKFFAQVGPYLGYWLNGTKYSSIYASYLGSNSAEVYQTADESYIFNLNKKDNRIDFGASFGGGFQYMLKRKGKEHMQFYGEARYSRGFLDLQSGNSDPNYAGQFNSNVTFNFGLLYILPSKTGGSDNEKDESNEKNANE